MISEQSDLKRVSCNINTSVQSYAQDTVANAYNGKREQHDENFFCDFSAIFWAPCIVSISVDVQHADAIFTYLQASRFFSTGMERIYNIPVSPSSFVDSTRPIGVLEDHNQVSAEE